MKRLLQSSPVIDPLVARSLEIIDGFDDLIDQSARLTGLKVGVCDLANDSIVGQPAAEGEVARAALGELQRSGVRGRRVELVELDEEPTLVASIELAHGCVGVVWLRGAGIDDTAHLVAERLAAAAAVTVLRSLAPARAGNEGWTELLTSLLTEAEAEELGAQLRLGPGVARLVVVARPRPGSSISPAALAQVLHRKLGARGATATSVVVRGDAVVVGPDDSRLTDWLTEATDELGRLGIAVEVGIGAAGRLHQLRDSWLQALDALTSCDLLQAPVLRATEAGALSLLHRIPADLILSDRDVRGVRALSAGDRALLRAFLVSGSLRATASRVFLHHTSVRYRLARIGEALQLDLTLPLVQHRLFVACALLAAVEPESTSAAI